MGDIYKSPIWIIALCCSIVETLGIILFASEHNSACIQAEEIGVEAHIFYVVMSILLAPDILYVVLSIFSPKVMLRPMGIIWNAVSAIFCFISMTIIFISLTFCGNTAQNTFLLVSIFVLLSGIGHLCNMVLISRELPPGELFKRIQ